MCFSILKKKNFWAEKGLKDMNSTIIPEMSLTTVDLDDDVIYSVSNRNFILRKLFDYLPYGSFEIIKADDAVAI